MMKLTINRKYDRNNRLISEEGVSSSYSFEYDENGNCTRYTEVNSITGEIVTDCIEEFDKKGNLVHRINKPDLIDFRYKYDENNRLIEVFGESESTIYEYDEKGNLLKEIGMPENKIIKEYINIYDQNIPNIEFEEDDNRIIISYDKNGRILDQITSFYHIQYKYDERGNKIYYTDFEGTVKEYKYRYDEHTNRIYKLVKGPILNFETIYFNNKKIMTRYLNSDEIYIYIYDIYGNPRYELNKFGEIEIEYNNDYES